MLFKKSRSFGLAERFQLSDNLCNILKRENRELTNGQAELIASSAISFSDEKDQESCVLLANRLLNVVRTFEKFTERCDSN